MYSKQLPTARGAAGKYIAHDRKPPKGFLCIVNTGSPNFPVAYLRRQKAGEILSRTTIKGGRKAGGEQTMQRTWRRLWANNFEMSLHFSSAVMPPDPVTRAQQSQPGLDGK
jgi:hypothetical protein